MSGSAAESRNHVVHRDLTRLCARLPPPVGRRVSATGHTIGVGSRRAAVLVLLTNMAGQWDLLLIRRAGSLSNHAGQMAFPGGSIDAQDGDGYAPECMVRAALREAREEVGLDTSEVTVVSVQPAEAVSGGAFAVSPVIAWRSAPEGRLISSGPEVAATYRVPIARLAAPANRVWVRHPSGNSGPGFVVDGQLVWGFTAALVDRLIRGAGWELRWDEDAPTVDVR